MDLGAFTPQTYTFRERDMVLDLFEDVCGQRMTCNYLRIGGVSRDLPAGFVEKAKAFLKYFEKMPAVYDELLSNNPIFIARTKNVGKLSADAARTFAVTGPNLRGSGVDYDARKHDPYCGYENYEFEVPLGKTGSCWDRFWCRTAEMRQSIRIVEQAFYELDAPIARVCTAEVPIPYAKHLEEAALPQPDKIVAAVHGLFGVDAR